MKFFKLNEAQRKHLAGLVDKIAWAYSAGVGGVAWYREQYVFALHAVLAFAIMESVAVLLLRQVRKERADE